MSVRFRSTKTSKFLGACLASLLILGTTLGIAAPAQAVTENQQAVAAAQCGYHLEGLIAYYNNYSDNGTNTWVSITSIIDPGSPPGLGGGKTLVCLSPGDHYIGKFVWGIITYAASDGKPCENPNE